MTVMTVKISSLSAVLAGCVSVLPLIAIADPYLELAHYAPVLVLRDKKTHKIVNPWQGTKASLGFVKNTGNSTTQTLNAASSLQYATGNWVYLLNTSFIRNSSKDGLSAQRFVSTGQTQYNFSKKMYTFFQGSYVNDKFDGYTYVINENIGLGRRLYNTDAFKWTVQSGPGAQQERVKTTGRNRNLFAFLGSTTLNWQMTKTASVSEILQSNWTDENAHTSSELAFATNIGAGFQTQIGFTWAQDTRPQTGSKHVSTLTTVSLVYNFA